MCLFMNRDNVCCFPICWYMLKLKNLEKSYALVRTAGENSWVNCFSKHVGTLSGPVAL